MILSTEYFWENQRISCLLSCLAWPVMIESYGRRSRFFSGIAESVFLNAVGPLRLRNAHAFEGNLCAWLTGVVQFIPRYSVHYFSPYGGTTSLLNKLSDVTSCGTLMILSKVLYILSAHDFSCFLALLSLPSSDWTLGQCKNGKGDDRTGYRERNRKPATDDSIDDLEKSPTPYCKQKKQSSCIASDRDTALEAELPVKSNTVTE